MMRAASNAGNPRCVSLFQVSDGREERDTDSLAPSGRKSAFAKEKRFGQTAAARACRACFAVV